MYTNNENAVRPQRFCSGGQASGDAFFRSLRDRIALASDLASALACSCKRIAMADDGADFGDNSSSETVSSSESQYLTSADDEEQDRKYWMVNKCPRAKSCSRLAWGKVCKYSYTSAEKCQKRIVEHLVRSGKHELPDDVAADIVKKEVVPEMCTETYADRKQYRRQLKRQQKTYKRKRAAADADAPVAGSGAASASDGGGGGLRLRERRSVIADEVSHAVTDAFSRMQGAHPSLPPNAFDSITALGNAVTDMRGTDTRQSLDALLPKVIDQINRVQMSVTAVVNANVESARKLTVELKALQDMKTQLQAMGRSAGVNMG